MEEFFETLSTISSGSERHIRSFFGVSKFTCFAIFMKLKMNYPELKAKHLFWTLHHFKSNETIDNACNYWQTTNKTYQKHINRVLYFLYFYLDEV